MELTICYETRYEEAQIHKANKCADLIEEIKERNFITDLITLEGGGGGGGGGGFQPDRL